MRIERPVRNAQNARIARKARRRGHVAAEMALGFLPLFAMFIGILEFSFSVFMQSTFQNATRDAVRTGITFNMTYNGTTYCDQTALMEAVAQANTFGFLSSTLKLSDGTYANTKIEVNYYFPDNLSAPATSAELPHTTTTSPAYVITALNQTGNVVETRVNAYPWNWMVPLPKFMPGTGISLSASSLDVLESLPPSDLGVYPAASPLSSPPGTCTN